MTKDTVARDGVVAAPVKEAADAGLEILRRGGNAVDAAAAMVIALSVVGPMWAGLGGYGGVMLVYSATKKKVIAIDFDSRAPLAFRPPMMEGDTTRFKTGYMAVSVPATVAGLDLALREYGTMSWKDAAEPAARLAENGFKVDDRLAMALQKQSEMSDPVSRKALFPDGKVPRSGDLWVQRDQGRLIRRLGAEGPGSFYRGEIPKMIARQVRENGGILSEQDFTPYLARVVTPISLGYKGWTVYEAPPPSGGLVTLDILNAMGRIDLSGLKPWGSEDFHLLGEVMKACWADRNAYLADPDFKSVPVDMLLSQKHGEELAAHARSGKVNPGIPPKEDTEHTIHVVAADKSRNVVSLTATHGGSFGSRVVIDGLGIAIGHGTSRFDFRGSGPNLPEAGKRMRHNMSPAIVMKDGKVHFAIGLPGGMTIPNVMAQLIMDLLDFRTSVSGAIAAPRIHTQAGEPLAITESAGADTVAELEKKGHTILPKAALGGIANGLALNHRNDTISAASGAGPRAVGALGAVRSPKA